MAGKLTHKIIHEIASINDPLGFLNQKEELKKTIVVSKEVISSSIMPTQGGGFLLCHVCYIEELCTEERHNEWAESKKVKKFENTLHKA